MGGEEADAPLVRLLVEGRRLRLYAYRARDGSVPLLQALDRLRRQHPQLEGGYGARWERMAQEGPERMKPDHYHKWTKRKDARLQAFHGAFKDLHSKTRIPCFFDGQGRMILTHLIEGKKEDELGESDKRDTLAIFEEYQRRKAELARNQRKKSAPHEKTADRRT